MLAECEALIVGGGPVGLVTAIELRRRGLDVLVVDRGQPPIDKGCGEGLMPDGVQALHRLGMALDEVEHAPFRGIRYLEGEVVAEADFAGVVGAGIRRTTLHRALVERAEEVEVRALWGLTVRGLAAGQVETDRGRLRGEWIIGADGLHSRVRQWTGLADPRRSWQRCGVRRHYALAPWSDRVEVYWGDGCEAYVTPVADRQLGVAFLWSGQKASFDSLLAGFPALERRLRGATIDSRDRGAAWLEQRSRAFCRGRVALVGDAAGYRDAITGEGLSVGFHQAREVAEAIANGDLEEYEKAARRVVALPFLLIRLLLEAERRPWLRRRLIRALATEPDLFARLLAVHIRQSPPRSVGPKGVLQLARGLLG